MIRVPALGAILLGLMATKSLGGLLSLAGGLVTWLIVRAATRKVSLLSGLAVACVVGGVALLGGWMIQEWGIGREGLQVMTSQSVVGRLDKSTSSRIQIWTELRRRFEARPLGIGPGNSSSIMLSVSNRERRGGSVYGKEAHNDYVGYAVERGPFALLALLATIVLALRVVHQGWSRARDPSSPVAGAWAAALAAGLVGSSIHSFTIEKLHFRHYWFFLALLFALSARMQTRGRDTASGTR
jgi:O-antigen ligase